MKFDATEQEVHTLNILPDSNEEVIITRKVKGKEPLPPFNLVGNGKANRYGTSCDILKICKELNRAEIALLAFIRDMFTRNTIEGNEAPNVVIPTEHAGFDKYLKTALKKNYAHMEYMEIIRRVKRGRYILNPKLYMSSTQYSKMLLLWNSLAKDKDEENNTSIQ